MAGEHFVQWDEGQTRTEGVGSRAERPNSPASTAHALHHRDTRDLAWWHIRQWAPATHRVVTTAVPSTMGAGLSFGLIFALAFGPATGLVAGLACGLSNGAAVGLVVGLRDGPGSGGDALGHGRLGGSRAVSPGLAGGLASGLSAGVAAGVVVGLARGLVAGVVAAPVVGLGFGLESGTTERLLEARRRTGPRRLRPLRWNAVASGANLAVGLAFGLTFASAFGLTFGLAHGLAFGLAGGLAIGLTGVLLFGVINGLVQGAADTTSPMDPVTLWRRDRQSGLVEGIAYGLLALIGYGVAGGIVAGTGVGIALGLTAGLGVGLAFTIGVSQSWLAVIAFWLLDQAGLFPRQGIRFLEDARERGVLRTAGSVYQFRHARLQDRLVTAHAPTPSA